jgi:hypothetical protein
MSKKPPQDDRIEDLRKDVQNLALSTNTHAGAIDNIKESIEKIESKFDGLTEKVDSNKDEIIAGVKKEFVQYLEFKPVKAFVYGLISLICVVVGMAVMACVISPYIQHKEQVSPINSLMPPK